MLKLTEETVTHVVVVVVVVVKLDILLFVYSKIITEIKSYLFMVHPLLPVPRLYRNLGVIPG